MRSSNVLVAMQLPSSVKVEYNVMCTWTGMKSIMSKCIPLKIEPVNIARTSFSIAQSTVANIFDPILVTSHTLSHAEREDVACETN